MQKFYCDNDAVHSDPVGLDFGQFGTYYQSQDVDGELQRLRERVAELEKITAADKIITQQLLKATDLADERESLLMEALRWVLDNSVIKMIRFIGDRPKQPEAYLVTTEEYKAIAPPADIAPLIAELVKP